MLRADIRTKTSEKSLVIQIARGYKQFNCRVLKTIRVVCVGGWEGGVNKERINVVINVMSGK